MQKKTLKREPGLNGYCPMTSKSILIRDTDKVEFRVVRLGHWSDIISDAGETDLVKWYGPGYVSNKKGFSYTVKDEEGKDWDYAN